MVLSRFGGSSSNDARIRTVFTTVDQVLNSDTTLTNVPEIFFDLKANTRYMVTGSVLYSAHAAADMDITWIGPAGAVGFFGGGEQVGTFARDLGVRQFCVGLGSAVFAVYWCEVLIETGATAGNLQLQFSQFFSDANPTTMRDRTSFMIMELGPA